MQIIQYSNINNAPNVWVIVVKVIFDDILIMPSTDTCASTSINTPVYLYTSEWRGQRERTTNSGYLRCIVIICGHILLHLSSCINNIIS